MSQPQKDKEINGQWITIDNFQNYTALANSLADLVGDNILGFVYIDHIAGLTLEVVKLFKRVNDTIEFTESLIDKEIRVIIRYAQFSKTLYQVIEGNSLGNYEFVKPLYLKSYDRDDLIDFRKNKDLDAYRAEGFPDDIKILLVGNDDVEPELVWGRVEKYDNSKNAGISQLMVQPHQNFGINKNEQLIFALTEIDDKMWIIGIIDYDKAKGKPWWKIW